MNSKFPANSVIVNIDLRILDIALFQSSFDTVRVKNLMEGSPFFAYIL